MIDLESVQKEVSGNLPDAGKTSSQLPSEVMSSKPFDGPDRRGGDSSRIFFVLLLVFLLLLAAVFSLGIYLLGSFLTSGMGVKNTNTVDIIPSVNCGDEVCSQGEDCQSCIYDCLCGKGEVCWQRACTKMVADNSILPYGSEWSVDLPDEPGKSWNISFRTSSNRMKVASKDCFYLDVIDPAGLEIDPYGANSGVCASSDGREFEPTGPGSAAWFNWGGCASEKYYSTKNDSWIIFAVRTDRYSCQHPNFDVYEMIDGEWLRFAGTQRNDVQWCASAADQTLRNRCYGEIAVRTLNASLCEDEGINDSLTGGRLACYTMVARASGDMEVCRNIEYPGNRGDCYGTVAADKDDPNLCSELKGEEQAAVDQCIISVAGKRKDPSLCEGLASVPSRDGCFYEVAWASAEGSICGRIDSNELRDYCINRTS